MKTKLLVSFSGGETSAYMAQWLWNNKRDEYDMIFVFANTGLENDETLNFVNRCQLHFGFPIVWVEAEVNPLARKGTKHRVVDYVTANREGRPFEDTIKKFGIPNMATPHCTREMKQRPIESYAKSIGWHSYYTALGIRVDEPKRISPNFCARKLLYPLIHARPMTKPKINFWWSQQPFRLGLKGYQGNCKSCWKKSDNKLYAIAKENEMAFSFFGHMELKYDKYIPESRLALMELREELPQQLYPVRFFRGNKSVQDIVNESKNFTKEVLDDAMQFDESESCDVYTECNH